MKAEIRERFQFLIYDADDAFSVLAYPISATTMVSSALAGGAEYGSASGEISGEAGCC